MTSTTTITTPTLLPPSLLRPPILHILRAAGFHSARPSVVDTLVDLTTRYLTLLARQTARYAALSPHAPTPTIQDVRMAMQECGVFRPQMSVAEEAWLGEEDLRGVEGFLEWVTGRENKEIMRIAGIARASEGPEGRLAAGEVLVEEEREDYLTALKKKHNRTGDESKYQGTVLGKAAETRAVKIEGGTAESIQDWGAKLQEKQRHHSRSVTSPTGTEGSVLSDAITMDDDDDAHEEEAEEAMEGVEAEVKNQAE